MADASPLGLLALLCMGHFVGDFALQNDRMAVEKCPGSDVTLPWWWWLLGHASCHGLFVALLSGVPLLGCAEFVVHALLDLGKCRLRYSLMFDQILHLICKVIWVALAFAR